MFIDIAKSLYLTIQKGKFTYAMIVSDHDNTLITSQ